MKTIKFRWYISDRKYDKGIISPLIGEIGYIANKKDCLKFGPRKLLISHEEIEFCSRWWNPFTQKPDEFLSYATIPHIAEKGICFSSATRGKKTGVRFAPSSEIIGRHPERWLTITVNVPDEVEEGMWKAAKSIEGAGYDYIGVIGKTTWFTDWFQSYDRWYCSEACNWIACQARWALVEAVREFDYSDWAKWNNCFSKHRRWGPLANMLLMIKAGYAIESYREKH